MELNAVTTIKVGDLEVDIAMQWGEMRKLARMIGKANKASAESIFDKMSETLQTAIADLRGLTRKGQAVAWSPELVDDLPIELVKKLFDTIMDIGTAEQEGDPLTVGTPAPMPSSTA